MTTYGEHVTSGDVTAAHRSDMSQTEKSADVVGEATAMLRHGGYGHLADALAREHAADIEMPFVVVRRDGHVLARLRYVPDVEGAFWGWTGVRVIDNRPRDEHWATRDMPWGIHPRNDTFEPPVALDYNRESLHAVAGTNR